MEREAMEMEKQQSDPSFTDILKNIGDSAKDVISDESQLLKKEVRLIIEQVGTELRNTAIYGGLTLLAVFPFLSFLIISIGLLLNERYWLSSLLVTLIWSGLCASLAYMYFKKMKRTRMELQATAKKTQQVMNTVNDKLQEVKDAIG